MVCLGFEPGAAGWKARTNPLSYSGLLILLLLFVFSGNILQKKLKVGFGGIRARIFGVEV